jgi:hypothetical protein
MRIPPAIEKRRIGMRHSSLRFPGSKRERFNCSPR